MRSRNIVNLTLISLAKFFGGISLTLLTPFYPVEALSKGVSVTQSGLVQGLEKWIAQIAALLDKMPSVGQTSF